MSQASKNDRTIFDTTALRSVDAEAGSVISENQRLGNHRTVSATCQTHRGRKGFCNLRLTKVGGEIVLDPHVTGCCVLRLDEIEARVVRDTLIAWLG
ncbi:MAG: hypothetical protein ACRDRA_00355 [Pseudonocardiaceae bacterium]